MEIEIKVALAIAFVVVNFMFITLGLHMISLPNTVAVLFGIAAFVVVGCLDSLVIRKFFIPLFRGKS